MPECVGADERKTTVSWYIAALKKYAIFNGRSRRMEFWGFALVNLLILIALGVVDFTNDAERLSLIGSARFSLIYGLAVLIPAISVTVRRLHDTGRTGWWLLINLLPVIGWLVILIFMLLGGKPQRNQYGPDPKGFNVKV